MGDPAPARTLRRAWVYDVIKDRVRCSGSNRRGASARTESTSARVNGWRLQAYFSFPAEGRIRVLALVAGVRLGLVELLSMSFADRRRSVMRDVQQEFCQKDLEGRGWRISNEKGRDGQGNPSQLNTRIVDATIITRYGCLSRGAETVCVRTVCGLGDCVLLALQKKLSRQA